MRKTATILYGINAVTCIFIGILHTIAHYQDLVTPEIATLLNHEISVSGMDANIYQLWQGMSLMMGLLLIIIGLLQLLVLKSLAKLVFPPIGGSLIMILMLFFVIYTGYYFFGGWQIYGGSAGLVLQSICLFLCVKYSKT